MLRPCVLLSLLSFSWCQDLPRSCESPVYCYGNLLHTVQLARVFRDGKTFVDMKMRLSEAETLRSFDAFISEHPNPTKQQVSQFVSAHFEQGQELANWTLPDFQPSPGFVDKIDNATVKNFTIELIAKWPGLARRVRDEVGSNQKQYSLIPVPNGFIVPGGRFREYYYWDSYWIIDGLLVNEMYQTARGMIDNFLSLVERFGFIPNGGRVYYLQRSQPPLLTPMAHSYYQFTKNTSWLEKSVGTLEKELNYWLNQTVLIRRGFRTYTMAHYNVPSLGPRPESYREDIHTVAMFNESRKQEAYTDLKSGAESGWDFSNRWVFDEAGGRTANLSYINTRRVVPVDLNAFLCGAFRDISELFKEIGNDAKSAFWKDNYIELRTAIDTILWDEQDGIWYDYDLVLGRHRRYFYPSGLTPLWSRCFEESQGPRLGDSVLKYLQKEQILHYLGGIPTSEDQTGEQWDFPNAWPPLQDIVVRGLQNSGNEEAQKEAEILAQRWVAANIIGYHEKGAMFEKYDAVVPGQYGGGGEYEVQEGFGWSNGVALRFIHDYQTTKNTSHKIKNKTSSSGRGESALVLFWSLVVLLKIVS